MKKIISVVLLLVLFTSLTGCSFSESKTENEKCGGKAPTLIWDDQEFVAPYMPKNELPEGYEYIGTLTKENAADTGLEGCKIYAEKIRR